MPYLRNSIAYDHDFFSNYLLFKFINKCQKEILRCAPPFSHVCDFLRNRKLREVLNGQTFSWANVNARVSQGTILGPLLFLTQINDLANGLSPNAKSFVDDTSLFSVVHNANTTAKELNNDLVKISRCTYHWKEERKKE